MIAGRRTESSEQKTEFDGRSRPGVPETRWIAHPSRSGGASAPLARAGRAKRPAIAAALVSLIVATLAFAGCNGGDDLPDGPALIVYEANIDSNVDVFTINADTGETVQLTSGPEFDGSPAWSRDRQRILFTSSRDDEGTDNDLYTMAADGTDVRRLTSTTDGSEFSAKYSHDGKTIGYSMRKDGQYYIEVMDADGSNVRRLTEAYDFAEFPAWRPGDDEIFFMAIGEGTQAGDIHAVNVETKAVRTIISTPGADVCPQFTNDGKYVTYARSPLDEPNGEQDIFRHALTDTDTSGANDAALTSDPARDDYVSSSPDGKAYVFLSGRVNDFDLWLMDPDGSNQRILTDTPDARENVPDW